jgi:hypothetical protein
LHLDQGEADLLALEVASFARAIPDPNARPRFEALADAARSGDVPESLVPALETLLELVFTRGRPANRAVLQSIYGRTPRGAEQTRAAREVSSALKSLVGQTITELRVSAVPGGHTLAIETDRVRLSLELDAMGARVASLEAG